MSSTAASPRGSPTFDRSSRANTTSRGEPRRLSQYKGKTMAELSISPDVIRDALKDFAAAYEPTGAAATEVGTVIDAADGIAHIEGLPGVMANELVTFANGTQGLALNLDEHEIGTVVLGDFSGIEAGQEVTRTGEVLSVAVGDGYLGRVVDPLG